MVGRSRGMLPREIWAPWMAENALEILQSLCFLYLKAWPSPDFQRFKNLDPPLSLQNFIDDPPLWSPSPPPSPPINNAWHDHKIHFKLSFAEIKTLLDSEIVSEPYQSDCMVLCVCNKDLFIFNSNALRSSESCLTKPSIHKTRLKLFTPSNRVKDNTFWTEDQNPMVPGIRDYKPLPTLTGGDFAWEGKGCPREGVLFQW